MARVDPVRRLNDPALRGLAKDFRQVHFGNGLGGDEIGQHLARAYGRQLIGIPYHQQSRFGWQGLEDGVHQGNVDHGAFIQDQQIDIEGILFFAFEAATLGIDFEEPMEGESPCSACLFARPCAIGLALAIR